MVPPPFTGGRGEESLMFKLQRGVGGGARAPALVLNVTL